MCVTQEARDKLAAALDRHYSDYDSDGPKGGWDWKEQERLLWAIWDEFDKACGLPSKPHPGWHLYATTFPVILDEAGTTATVVVTVKQSSEGHNAWYAALKAIANRYGSEVKDFVWYSGNNLRSTEKTLTVSEAAWEASERFTVTIEDSRE